MPTGMDGVRFTARDGPANLGRRYWFPAAWWFGWSTGFRAPRFLSWSDIDRVEEHTRERQGSTVRRVRVAGRDGTTQFLPLPRSHSFFDPDPRFDHSAALLIDLSDSRLRSLAGG